MRYTERSVKLKRSDNDIVFVTGGQSKHSLAGKDKNNRTCVYRDTRAIRS